MISDFCETYGWPPNFWRRMGWRELRAWTRQLVALRERRHRQHTTSPHSWAGREHDGWWQEQDRKRGRR